MRSDAILGMPIRPILPPYRGMNQQLQHMGMPFMVITQQHPADIQSTMH